MRITIGIPTRDRPQGLAKLLASLHAQTYHRWDLVIVNDSVGDMLTVPGQQILDAIRRHHKVDVVEGVRINQTYAHNHVLWSPDTHPWVLRVDDDCILPPDYLERLTFAMWELAEKGEDVTAISGIVYTDHIHSRDEHPPIPWDARGNVRVGVRGESLDAMTFMQEYTDPGVHRTEHLYSSYLYSRDAMRQVGGFPLVYSRGVSYHEETDASYRLRLNGGKLWLCTGATMVHSHEGSGGTRLMSPSEHATRRESDWQLFQERLGLLRGVKHWCPSVAFCSQHLNGLGGAQRLTYNLLGVLYDLMSEGWISRVDLYPLLNEEYEDPDFVERHYGVRPPYEQPDAPNYYDVVISLGHTPPAQDEIPPRRQHIHYSLYPIGDGEIPRGVDRYACISEFAALGVVDRYHRNPEVVYPYVDMCDVSPDDIVKEKIILMIGRSGTAKSLYNMAVAYSDMDLPEGTELHIVLPQEGDNEEFFRLAQLSDDEEIYLHIGVEEEELRELYLRASLLWAARGFGMPKVYPELLFEHFGYTPVEALAHYCLPLAYDEGGYRETSLVRWMELGELERWTALLLKDREVWRAHLADNLMLMHRFSRERFKGSWQRIILTSNAHTWDSSIEWRKSDAPNIQVLNADIHVAVICDHPERTTGYGVINNQLCDGLLEAGMKVHIFGINDHRPDIKGKYASLWPSPKDYDMTVLIRKFLRHRPYDVALVCYDPFITDRLTGYVKRSNPSLPLISYVSQEGKPAHSAWEAILARSNVALAFCQSAADAVKSRFKQEVDWAWLGVDHAPFERYSDEDRRAMRSVLGWRDKFVIFCVCRNTRNKNIPGMMKAIKRVMDTHPEVDPLLVIHTQPVPNDRFHGINIEMYSGILEMGGISDDRRVVVSQSIYPDGTPYDSLMEDLFRMGAPRTPTETHEWFIKLGMIDRYNLADLYLDMSTAEGFCLPIFEAMSCGVPVLTVADDFVRQEIIGDYGYYIPAAANDVWITGADLMLPDVAMAAESIFAQWSGLNVAIQDERAKSVVEKLKWKNAQDKILEAIRQCLN